MGKTILIIEDEMNLAELLKFRLEVNGYHVETSYDGHEGVNKIGTMKPDLVILDVMLPKMDGYEVIRRIKSDSNTKDIPIVVLTARSQNEDLERARNLGAGSVISKPFDPKKLLSEIEKLLKR